MHIRRGCKETWSRGQGSLLFYMWAHGWRLGLGQTDPAVNSLRQVGEVAGAANGAGPC